MYEADYLIQQINYYVIKEMLEQKRLQFEKNDK